VEDGEEEWIDYDRVFQILEDIGFNGYLSIVYEERKTELRPGGNVSINSAGSKPSMMSNGRTPGGGRRGC